MSYKIRYKPTISIEKNMWHFLREHRRKVVCTIGIMACFLVGVWLGTDDAVRDFLIPGDADVTRAAFSEFGNDLREGVGFKDALTAFCIEIMENAETS